MEERVYPVHSWARRTFAPIYYVDQLKIVTPALLFSVVVLLTSRDLILFTTLVVLIYIGLLVVMRNFSPSRLSLPSTALPDVIDVLEKTNFLEREGSALTWVRKSASILKTKLDAVKVQSTGDRVVIEGRRIDLNAILIALNKRLR